VSCFRALEVALASTFFLLGLILGPQALIQGSLTLYFWLEVVGFRDVVVHKFALEKHSAERARCNLLIRNKKFKDNLTYLFFLLSATDVLERFAPIQYLKKNWTIIFFSAIDV
jgi:hypothetical protein